jgi:hypothetical protein
LLDRELIEQLYSSKSEVKRAAVYRLLFDRRYDMLDELKKAATFEKNEEMAVFMVQVCLTLENFPRDFSLERRIVELLQKPGGVVSLSEEMWKYLETHGSSQMLLATLGAMGDAIPPSAQDFIETCLTHPDPEIRAATCQKASKVVVRPILPLCSIWLLTPTRWFHRLPLWSSRSCQGKNCR